jgi:hypothetical protein
VLLVPLPAAGAPVLSAVPVGDVAPPGGLPDCMVLGATCDLMSPGDPCDFVASDELDWARALPAAISTQAENTAVLILFISNPFDGFRFRSPNGCCVDVH